MKRIVIAGGGAAGFFAAITCAERCKAEKNPAEILLLESGSQFLKKVSISGGGRCNVTHACFEPRALAQYYPRGGRALIGPFLRFGPADMIEWLEARGVDIKTERDGCVFPATDSSQTIIDCLLREARTANVILKTNAGLESAVKRPDNRFDLVLVNGEHMACDRLLLAMGGCRQGNTDKLLETLGHAIVSPVPSLFTFRIKTDWLRALSGISVEPVEVSVPGEKLRERGALLVTHWGVSGPAILRLSAWGARRLHELNYHFPLQIHWAPELSREELVAEFHSHMESHPAVLVSKTPLCSMPSRLWEKLLINANVTSETRWGAIPKAAFERLLQQITRTEFHVTGKSPHKAEFVTCGGVRLGDVDFKTMESRIAPGLYFAGELLDIDGLTGGFNFQAAWTTGWIAGRAMADSLVLLC